MSVTLLKAGLIVNTHGIRGDVRIQPWCDRPEFLLDFPVLYVDNTPLEVAEARVHKTFVLARFVTVSDVQAAARLKNHVVCVDKSAAVLPPGRFFVCDLIGLSAVERDSGAPLGVLLDVWPRWPQDIYVLETLDGVRHMVPNVPAFVGEIDLEKRTVEMTLIEGM